MGVCTTEGALVVRLHLIRLTRVAVGITRPVFSAGQVDIKTLDIADFGAVPDCRGHIAHRVTTATDRARIGARSVDQFCVVDRAMIRAKHHVYRTTFVQIRWVDFSIENLLGGI